MPAYVAPTQFGRGLGVGGWGNNRGPSTPRSPAPPTQGEAQRQALLNPPDISADTPTDPGQGRALSEAERYTKGLAEGSNEEITRALGRERDEISVGIKGEGEAAMGRGADPSLFRSRAVDAGARRLSDLHGKLTDIALGRRNDAIRTQTEAAGSAAGLRNQLHLGTMAQRLAEQRASTERSEVQARLMDAPYQRLLDLFGRVGGMTGGGGNTVLTGGGGGGGAPSPGGGYKLPESYKGPVWSRTH